MKMQSRLIACVLALVLVFSSVFSRPVYGNPAVIGAAEVVLTLMAAAGLTFAATDSGLIQDSVDQFLEDNPDVKAAADRLVTSCHDPLMGYLSIGLAYKDVVVYILQSIYSYFSTGSGSISTDVVPFESLPETYNYINSDYMLYVFSDGLQYYAYYVFLFFDSSDGRYYFRTYKYYLDSTTQDVVFDSELSRVFVTDFGDYSNLDFCFYISKELDFNVGHYCLFSSNYNDYRLFPLPFETSFGDLNTVYYNGLTVNLSGSSAILNPINPQDVISVGSDFSYVLPEDVTQDVILGAWDDALSQDNKDVIVYPLNPDDMVGVNGFDTAYGVDGVAGGAVVGVEVPVGAVDVPAGDMTGWLDKIYTKVSALPAAIGAAVIGTGSLSFDKFDNLSFASVFPFCIPFDLKNALIAFNAPPADPVWEVSFSGTFMEPAGSIVIDMRQFESLFKIVRFFIYGGFVVSLILLTRKIIKG